MIVGLVSLLILAIPLPVRSAAPMARTYEIQAGRFQYAPAVIHVNPGDHVTLKLSATDVVHGLSIDGYGLAITADPGQTAKLSFVADRAGAFRFRCIIPCGNLHPFMIGKLYVGQNWLLLRGSLLALLLVSLGFWKLWK